MTYTVFIKKSNYYRCRNPLCQWKCPKGNSKDDQFDNTEDLEMMTAVGQLESHNKNVPDGWKFPKQNGNLSDGWKWYEEKYEDDQDEEGNVPNGWKGSKQDGNLQAGWKYCYQVGYLQVGWKCTCQNGNHAQIIRDVLIKTRDKSRRVLKKLCFYLFSQRQKRKVYINEKAVIEMHRYILS